MVAPVLVGLLPGSIGDTVGKILPSNAGQAFMSVTDSTGLLSPGRRGGGVRRLGRRAAGAAASPCSAAGRLT